MLANKPAVRYVRLMTVRCEEWMEASAKRCPGERTMAERERSIQNVLCVEVGFESRSRSLF